MNQKGTAYILALFCLVVVSATTFLWQKELQTYPEALLDAWSEVIAEQAALSGIEYALATVARASHGTQTILVSGGTCTLTITPVEDGVIVRSVARVLSLRGPKVAVRTRHIVTR